MCTFMLFSSSATMSAVDMARAGTLTKDSRIRGSGEGWDIVHFGLGCLLFFGCLFCHSSLFFWFLMHVELLAAGTGA